MEKLNCVVQNLYDAFFKYIVIVWNLLIHRKAMMKLVTDKNIKLPVNENYFYTINIFILEIILFINAKISRFSTDQFEKEAVELIIPILGKMHINYLVNAVGMVIGSNIIIFILLGYIGENLKYYKALKKLVFYSSIYWIIIACIGFVLEIISIVLIILYIEIDGDFFANILVSSHALEELENAIIITTLLTALFGFLKGYMYIMLLMDTIKSNFKQVAIKIPKIYVAFLILFFLGTFFNGVKSAIMYYSLDMTKNNIKMVDISLNLINIQRKIDGLDAQIKGDLDGNKTELFSNKQYIEFKDDIITSYKYLSKDKLMPINERIDFYTKYYLVYNIDEIYRLSKEDGYLILNNIITDSNDKKYKYKELLINNNINPNMIKEFKLLENEKIKEYNYYGDMASMEIFLYKLSNQGKEIYSFIYTLSNFIVIFP